MKVTGVPRQRKQNQTFFAVARETPLSAANAMAVSREQSFLKATMTVRTAQCALEGRSAASVVKEV
jgi:hypothetical protein